MQGANRIEGDYVIGVLRHDPVEILGRCGLLEGFVQLANGEFVLAGFAVHVRLLSSG